MSTPALYDINALLTNPYTPIHKIRAAIKFLTRREELSEAETADLALLEKEERRVRALYRSRKPIYLPIGNGRFSLGGRPSEARLAQLKADG